MSQTYLDVNLRTPLVKLSWFLGIVDLEIFVFYYFV